MDVRVIMVRDPDGGTTSRVFIDGSEVRHSETVIDAGAGWEWTDWVCLRDEEMQTAATVSPEFEAAMREALTSPPGRSYIEGKPHGEPWI